MKLLATLFALALGHRMNSVGPENDRSNLLSGHEAFMKAEVGAGKMTSWTGASSISVVKVRRLGGFARAPYWEIYKGNNNGASLEGKPASFTWKSWFNPIAKSRNSVREGDKHGNTINRIHYNQLRRLNARARAFITTPGKRSETFYTMSLLGQLGKWKETSQTGHHFNGRTSRYNMGVGKCSGSWSGSTCKGRLYTGKAFNFGYKIHIFKGEKLVASAELADTKGTLIDKYIIGEKKRFEVNIEAGQDNMAVAEFVGFIADLEEYVWLHY